MATNQPRERERAGYLRDEADDGARTGVHAETGKPQAEHSQYGMVREKSPEAEGLNERQIRGVEPKPEGQGEPPDIDTRPSESAPGG